ncbi:hypothetical protein ACMT4L_16885 [Deinococcus sp. A31D244]|uniref:hypothetical protein n=1 Tax=Deinococcus sp. A31D244 TaxID=3397675 RepID=UPI0039E18198
MPTAAPRAVLGHLLTPWQARALYALPETPVTASRLLEAAQYARANALYPHQRRELLALAPALLSVTTGPHGPLYARTPDGSAVALAAFPDTPPDPPRRGGGW